MLQSLLEAVDPDAVLEVGFVQKRAAAQEQKESLPKQSVGRRKADCAGPIDGVGGSPIQAITRRGQSQRVSRIATRLALLDRNPGAMGEPQRQVLGLVGIEHQVENAVGLRAK